MVARISALVVWALVAAAAVFWGLRLFARPPEAPPTAVAVGESTAVRGDLTRLFGAPPVPVAVAAAPAVEAPSRFRLLGVMAPRSRTEGQGGVALIAIDGRPARAYVVGAPLDASLVLQSVSLRAASIGPASGAAGLRLEMPPLPSAATGTLPSAGGVPVPPARTVPSFQPMSAPTLNPVLVPPQLPAGGQPPMPPGDGSAPNQ